MINCFFILKKSSGRLLPNCFNNMLLEKVIGRGMRARVERVAQLVGFVLLITLVLAVTYRDILGLIN